MSVKEKIILYIDDDAEDRELFSEAVQELHPELQCIMVEDGIKAIETLETIEVPLCIYLDINMPLMSGLDVLKSIKKDARTADVPVFILSTSRANTLVNEARSLGAADYLVKPNNYDEFLEILKACFVAHLKI